MKFYNSKKVLGIIIMAYTPFYLTAFFFFVLSSRREHFLAMAIIFLILVFSVSVSHVLWVLRAPFIELRKDSMILNLTPLKKISINRAEPLKLIDKGRYLLVASSTDKQMAMVNYSSIAKGKKGLFLEAIAEYFSVKIYTS